MHTTSLQPYNLARRAKARAGNIPPLRYPDLGLICLALFVMLVGVGAVTPIRAIYARDHGATMAELGFMASAFLLGTFAFQLPGGWASDRWGRKPFIVTGMAVVGVISLLFLLSDHPWYFIVLRFVEGAATGAITPSANAFVMDTIPARERGAAFGWLGSAFSAGFMMGPALGGLMVDWIGYASPFLFGGATSLLMALYLVFKMPGRRPGTQATTPEAASVEPEESRAKHHIPGSLFVPALAAALVLTSAAGFGDGLFISIWTIWLNDLHASTSFIGLTFVAFSVPLMLFMPVSGKMADRRSLTPLIAVPGVLICVSYLIYGFTTDLLLIVTVGIFEGACVAVMGPAYNAFVANLSPSNARGRLQGVISTVRTMSAFASSMLTAVLYEGSVRYPFLMLAGVQLFATVVGGFLVWRVERKSARAARLASPENARAARKEPGSGPVLETAAK